MKARYVNLFAAYSLWMGGFMVHRAIAAFNHPFPASMAGQRWYDHVLTAVMYAIIAGACIAYGARRRQNRRSASLVMPSKSPWRDRRELRFVVYSFAVIQFINIPLAVLTAIRASHDRSFPGTTSFFDAFSFDCLVFAGLGVAVVFYDRYRMRLESRITSNQCLHCGYDLRATPDRCPECGTSVMGAK